MKSGMSTVGSVGGVGSNALTGGTSLSGAGTKGESYLAGQAHRAPDGLATRRGRDRGAPPMPQRCSAALWPAASLAGWQRVPVPARVVADLEGGAADGRAGEPAGQAEQLGMAGDLLEPAGHQLDLVGQVAWRWPLERLRRAGRGQQAFKPLRVVGRQHGA